MPLDALQVPIAGGGWGPARVPAWGLARGHGEFEVTSLGAVGAALAHARTKPLSCLPW